MSEGVLAESKGSWSCSGHVGMLVRAGRDNVEPVPVKSLVTETIQTPGYRSAPGGVCSIPDALQNTKNGIKAWEKAAPRESRATIPTNCLEGLLQVPKLGKPSSLAEHPAVHLPDVLSAAMQGLCLENPRTG